MGSASSSLWWSVPVATLAVVSVVAVVVTRRRRQRRGHEQAEKLRKSQIPRVEIAARVPGNGTPLFHGVRVVEVANTVAAPMAARMLAELGAEVIKVEPVDGDPWRVFLVNFERPRTSGSSFESANLNKSSVTADFTTAEGMQKLRDLLRDADVLITNTRPQSRQRLGLTDAELARDFPHLVVASINAWGSEGPDAQLPGYDLGAYYAATGLATTINTPDMANAYATGFGDVATAGALVAAVSVALRRRLISGAGGLVSTALLRTAAFSLTPLLLTDAASEAQLRADRASAGGAGPVLNGVDCAIGRARPNYDDRYRPPPLHTIYPTRGRATAVTLAVDTLDARATAAAEAALAKAFALDADAPFSYASIKRALADVDHDEVLARLAAHGVPHHPMMRMLDLIKLNESSQLPLIAAAEAFTDAVPGVADIDKWVRVPFQCHCSDDHRPRYGAPAMGAHNDSVARKAWSDRLPQALLPREPTDRALAATLARAPLADVVVVELSATPLAAAAGVMFADLGATVTLVEERARLARSLRQREPLLWRSLARGKRSLAVAALAAAGDAGVQAVHQLLAKAHVFLCDWETHELAPLGLDAATLRARYPQLVLANGTAYGTNASAALPASDVAAFWGASGLASVVAGAPLGDVPTPPPHFGALVAAVQLFAGAAAALFHLRRTGEGQRTDVNLLRSGLFGQSALGLVTIPRAPEKAAMFMQDPATRRLKFLVPTAHCLLTKDGFWVQLLGAEFPRHFWRTTKALRVPRAAFIGRLLWAVLTKVLVSKQKDLSLRVLPAMSEVCRTFIFHMSQLTYAEAVEEFKKHDVWFTVIRMPRNFRAFEQAHINGAFQVANDGTFVTSIPFDIDQRASATADAPTLQQE